MDIIALLQNDLLKALIASLGGCLLRYLVDHKDGKEFHFLMCIADCTAAIFLGFYSYTYIIEELKLDALHGSILNIIIGYVGADGVNIAKGIILKKLYAHFKVQGEHDEKTK